MPNVRFDCVKDLEVHWSLTHCEAIASNAYKTLGSTDPKDFLNAFHLCKETVVLQSLQPSMEVLPIKDIFILERVQRRATKYILSNYSSSYKTRLAQLNLLPLMYQYELSDYFLK